MACPECGADYNSGWKKNADESGYLNLPDDNFRYDEWERQEFGGSPKPAQIKPLWWIAAILLIIALTVICLYGI